MPKNGDVPQNGASPFFVSLFGQAAALLLMVFAPGLDGFGPV